MAMLTNAYETQVVQSLGVRIGTGTGKEASGASGSGCPFSAMMPAAEGASETRPPRTRADSRLMDSRRGGQAREHSRVHPPHGADRHREIRPGARSR